MFLCFKFDLKERKLIPKHTQTCPLGLWATRKCFKTHFGSNPKLDCCWQQACKSGLGVNYKAIVMFSLSPKPSALIGLLTVSLSSFSWRVKQRAPLHKCVCVCVCRLPLLWLMALFKAREALESAAIVSALGREASLQKQKWRRRADEWI